MRLDLQAQLAAECAAIRIKDRNLYRWDRIGDGSRRGHLHYYTTDYGECNRIAITYQWSGLPTANITDGRAFETPGIVCYTDGSQIDDSPVGFSYLIRSEIYNGGEHGNIGKKRQCIKVKSSQYRGLRKN